MTTTQFRLCDVSLEGSAGGGNTYIEKERAAAVSDLLQENRFIPVGHSGGPYRLRVKLAAGNLSLHISTEKGEPVVSHSFSLDPFRKLLKEYALICANYYEAIPRARVESFVAIDVARRSIHDDGSEMLREQLSPNVTVDSDTARRLFTLVYVMLMRKLAVGSGEPRASVVS